MAEPAESFAPHPALQVTILGCGGAGGVPTLSKGWGQCNPANPRNRRRRASILVESDTTRVLIDASPDLREQLLDAEVNTLDAVVFTHAHADHIHGLDELREINRAMGGPLDIWADAVTLKELETRFAYAFEGIDLSKTAIYKPWLLPNVIEPQLPFTIGELDVLPILQDHGIMETLGFRIGDFAYSTDFVRLPDTARTALRGLDLWIVGALTNDSTHETHVSLDTALDWIADLKPRRAIITHMGPGLDYEQVLAKCPPGVVVPAHDGLVVSV